MVWEHQKRYLVIVVYAQLELRSPMRSRDRDWRVLKAKAETEAMKNGRASLVSTFPLGVAVKIPEDLVEFEKNESIPCGQN